MFYITVKIKGFKFSFVSKLLFFTSCFFLVSCESQIQNDSNIGDYEDAGDLKTVSVCRECGLVVEYEGERLYPDNSSIKESCNQWEGHMWYNAGTSGNNPFKCKTCGVVVTIKEDEPRCMTFCEEACGGASKHDWVRMN